MRVRITRRCCGRVSSWQGSPGFDFSTLARCGLRCGKVGVSDRLADGLIVAGLPGKREDYYRILRENRLTGGAIRDLLFGVKVEGTGRTGAGEEWSVKWTNDGKAIVETWVAAGQYSETGRSWIEADMICNDFPFIYMQGEHCASVFRNPNGKYKTRNEYLMLTDFGIFPFSPVK